MKGDDLEITKEGGETVVYRDLVGEDPDGLQRQRVPRLRRRPRPSDPQAGARRGRPRGPRRAGAPPRSPLRQSRASPRQALTHRSYGTPHNERLEFLGDSLLNCAVATLLYERFPQLPEGDLSRLRAALVNQSSLSEVAAELGLGDRLRLGEGELKSGGFRRPVDPRRRARGDAGRRVPRCRVRGGARRGRAAAGRAAREPRAASPVDKDPKTALQEHLQGRKLALPRYSVQLTEGEAHDQTFIVECRVDDLGIVATRARARAGARPSRARPRGAARATRKPPQEEAVKRSASDAAREDRSAPARWPSSAARTSASRRC